MVKFDGGVRKNPKIFKPKYFLQKKQSEKKSRKSKLFFWTRLKWFDHQERVFVSVILVFCAKLSRFRFEEIYSLIYKTNKSTELILPTLNVPLLGWLKISMMDCCHWRIKENSPNQKKLARLLESGCRQKSTPKGDGRAI